MNPSARRELRRAERAERIIALGWWGVAVGIVAALLAVGAVGLGGINNPKSASSIYSVFALAGMLRGYVWPIVGFGAGCALAGTAVILSQRHRT